MCNKHTSRKLTSSFLRACILHHFIQINKDDNFGCCGESSSLDERHNFFFDAKLDISEIKEKKKVDVFSFFFHYPAQ